MIYRVWEAVKDEEKVKFVAEVSAENAEEAAKEGRELLNCFNDETTFSVFGVKDLIRSHVKVIKVISYRAEFLHES